MALGLTVPFPGRTPTQRQHWEWLAFTPMDGLAGDYYPKTQGSKNKEGTSRSHLPTAKQCQAPDRPCPCKGVRGPEESQGPVSSPSFHSQLQFPFLHQACGPQGPAVGFQEQPLVPGPQPQVEEPHRAHCSRKRALQLHSRDSVPRPLG